MEFNEVKIEIYVPQDYVIPLRDALSAVGAGHIGNYDHCVSVTQVTGYWRPLENARPFQGKIGEICEGSECKIEIRCQKEFIAGAVKVIRQIHPYEEPVINIIPLINSLYHA
jgi:hypothetical protein